MRLNNITIGNCWDLVKWNKYLQGGDGVIKENAQKNLKSD